jgi:TRAP transporter TAXI family solute receptor
MRKTWAVLIYAAIIFPFALSTVPVCARSVYVSIGTGGITGVYYPTGGAIARVINKKRKQYGIRMNVEATGGSVYNVNAVMGGELEFGIVQSDRQYQAYEGLAEWKKYGSQRNLRAVFSLQSEAVTIVAADDAKIQELNDLRGKRVNIGNPGSGQRQNAIDALENAGIYYQKEIQAEWYRPTQLSNLLQEKRVDAFFYTTAHPNGLIKEATSGRRRVRLLSIQNIDPLLRRSRYYTKATIRIKFYPGLLNTKDVDTFGVRATLVTSVKVPDFIVYSITKEVIENLVSFKKLHPAFESIKKENMLEGLSAPIHPGALRYYRETGMIER